MSDSGTYTIVGIILLVIVIAVIIVLVLNGQEESQPIPLATYNQTCVVYASDSVTVPVCSIGLSCIKSTSTSTTGTCKKNVGTICTNTIECVPNLYCISGICSEFQSGGLNQPAPCLPGYVQVGDICKSGSGTSCSITEDCGVYSQQCVVTNVGNPLVKTCTVPKTDGQPCVYNDDCSSLYCNPETNLCSLNINPDGGLGSSCIYYSVNNNYTNCQETLACQRELANTNNTISSTGICLPTIDIWPANTTDTICNSNTNSCIPPSTCYNGECIFPPNFPLSCAVSTTTTTNSSSGGCLTGYFCINNTCVPSSGYPGVGSKWNVVEWIRSANGKMGYWSTLPSVTGPGIVPIINSLPEPGIRPSFSTYTSPTGPIIIYSPDVSTNNYDQNVTYNPYYIVQNGVQSILQINYVNTDAVTAFYADVPYLIKFIPSNVSMRIMVLTKQYLINTGNPTLNTSAWFVMTATLSNNILTVSRPNNSVYNSAAKIKLPDIPTDFNMDFRGLATQGRMMYNMGNDWWVKVCASPGTTNNFMIDLNATKISTLIPPINPPVFDLQFLTSTDVSSITQLVVNTGANMDIYNSGITFGSSDITKMSVTSFAPEFEIYFTQTHNSITTLNLVEGSNTVVMPVSVNYNTIPYISVMDFSLSTQLPNLYMLTTIAN